MRGRGKKLRILEWDETGRMGGTNTWPSVLHRLVCDRELSKVVSNHFSLDIVLFVHYVGDEVVRRCDRNV